uniref:Uncharacterized protein n=1 Tax=Ditylenchus dipsaci TaxID=166011 RepID=A0A915DJ07_9BILA
MSTISDSLDSSAKKRRRNAIWDMYKKEEDLHGEIKWKCSECQEESHWYNQSGGWEMKAVQTNYEVQVVDDRVLPGKQQKPQHQPLPRHSGVEDLALHSLATEATKWCESSVDQQRIWPYFKTGKVFRNQTPYALPLLYPTPPMYPPYSSIGLLKMQIVKWSKIAQVAGEVKHENEEAVEEEIRHLLSIFCACIPYRSTIFKWKVEIKLRHSHSRDIAETWCHFDSNTKQH